MSFYNTLGLEKLFEDSNTKSAFLDHISDNLKYIIPGYLYDHKLYISESYLEFYNLVDIDGKNRGMDIHFSDNNFVNFIIVQKMDNEDYYKVCCENVNVDFSAKLVNADVLPSLKKDQKIYGQTVAFAEASSLVKRDFESNELKIKSLNDECVEIDCIPLYDDYAMKGHFEFLNVSCDFWALQVKTAIGAITVLLDASNCNVDVEELNGFTVKAYLSIDVGTGVADFGVLYPYISYEDLIDCENDVYYFKGFVPNFDNSQKLLSECIVKNNYDSFVRACEKQVSFAVNDGEFTNKNRCELCDFLKEVVPQADRIERVHILESVNNVHLGYEALAMYKKSQLVGVLSVFVGNKGLVDEIVFFDADVCTVGIDYELNRISVLCSAMTLGKINVLSEYLSENCRYRSDYSDRLMFGSEAIIKFFNNVFSNMEESERYYGDINRAENELKQSENLPEIYTSKWCYKQFHETKEYVSSVVFILMDSDRRIKEIYLSRDNTYLNHQFEEEKYTVTGYNVRDILSKVYSNEDTIDKMRMYDFPDNDKYDTYVWKYADEYIRRCFWNWRYKVHKSELFEDCIGYSCTRRGKEYAIYVYAFGEGRTVHLTAEYCCKLRDYDLSKDKEILVFYLKVDKNIDEEGETEYIAGHYADALKEPEGWCLKTVNGRDILLFYPRSEMLEIIPTLLSAYNESNYDVMKSIFSKDIYMETFEYKRSLLSDFLYCHLSILRKNKGDMKLAYIRKNEGVFSCVGYIENYGYLGFSMNDKDKIDSLQIYSLGSFFREIIVDENIIDTETALYYPKLVKLDIYEPSEISHFSMRLEFDNGEIRRYDLPGDFDDSSVFKYDGKVLTDRIFKNARICESLKLEEVIGLRHFSQRGQGVEFISGINISSAELYTYSYPIEKFSYKNLDNVHTAQLDYDDDGYGVGYIHNLDPQNPYYLLDNNTKIARTLPQEYQDTPIYIEPFCGGTCEGLIMVSKMGELDLKYYHHFSGCAGMWGWLDLNFNVVIEPQYVYAKHFDNGKAIVCKGDWSITQTDNGERYWCENEQWGIIDTTGKEIVPCKFDELYEIDNSDSLYFAHNGGWDNGTFCIYDSIVHDVILELDFDFDMGYMFNECLVVDDEKLVLVDHLPGEGKDLICVYDLKEKKYLMYREEFTERTLNGEKSVIINKDGKEIIVF